MFILNANTQIISPYHSKPIDNAINILKRDLNKVFTKSDYHENFIILKNDEDITHENLIDESFTIDINDSITITAGDDLGFVYALLYISETYLGIKPFWFWMDQDISKKEKVEIQYSYYESAKPVVRFRGWFFNDEVLLMKWNINGDIEEPWRMALEALLRCGGNLAIPGTDKLSRKNRQLAADMGLWLTHHHAEPLGAEMFVRAYPEIEPNFTEHPELFYKLWEEAVIEQKDYNVIWNLCFRGQGDCPFWSNDTSGRFDTPEKRGALISEIIEKQCDLVRKYVKHPVFCTNLYGEIMELYKEGHIKLDPQIIKVKADNGYGKMVTRRRDNHSVRISSMPDENDTGCQGIYYHVSFYDLQAANHITMLPNSVDFVNKELSEVIAKGGNDFWIINCSNVRPHVYYLDAIRKKWFGREISDDIHSVEFASDYYSSDSLPFIAKCFNEYPKFMFPYGENEDEHAGEQYYTENIRILVHQFIVYKHKNAPQLFWLTGDIPLEDQVKAICNVCNNIDSFYEYYKMCADTSLKLAGLTKILFDSTLFLQVKIHFYCAKGVKLFGEAYEEYTNKNYKKAFILMGECAESFDQAENEMRVSEYGVWKGFYQNDCFADIKHTAYMVRKVMGIIRELGDNARHDKWYRETVYSVEDRDVFLLLVNDNHMTDWELYKAMKTT